MGKIELNIAVDADLLASARARGVDAERALEEGLRAAIDRAAQREPLDLLASAKRQKDAPSEASARARAWAEENAEAIRAHNQRIAERGVFGEDLRRW